MNKHPIHTDHRFQFVRIESAQQINPEQLKLTRNGFQTQSPSARLGRLLGVPFLPVSRFAPVGARQRNEGFGLCSARSGCLNIRKCVHTHRPSRLFRARVRKLAGLPPPCPLHSGDVTIFEQGHVAAFIYNVLFFVYGSWIF